MSHENPETAKIFLNLEDPPESQNAMSTESDEFVQDQPVAPARPQVMNTSGGVASGPALVALIAILGGGSIFGMRVVSKHAAVAAESFVIDYTESAIGTDFDARFESTMLNLERSTRPVQVPIAYLQRNPFMFSNGDEIFTPVDVAVLDDVDREELERLRKLAIARAEEAARQHQANTAMAEAVEGYELQSTLQGTNPVARVSGEIVRVGGTLAYVIERGEGETETSFFTVESIGGRAMVLVGPDGSRYEISIGMPFRELESVQTESTDDSSSEQAADVVDEFAAAAAAMNNANDLVQETQQPEGEPETVVEPEAEVDAESDVEVEAESEAEAKTEELVEDETPAPDSDKPEMSFMQRLKAASQAQQSQAAEQETEQETESEAEPTTDSNEDADSEAANEEEAADEAADQAVVEEVVEKPADEPVEEADESGDVETDEESDESGEQEAEVDSEEPSESDDEGGR